MAGSAPSRCDPPDCVLLLRHDRELRHRILAADHSEGAQGRRWHAAIPVFVCGVALALAVVYRTNLMMSVGLFVVAGGSFYGFQPVFWAVPTRFLSESAAAASIGLINAVGNLGGFVGPMVIGYLANRTHSFSPGLLYLVASLFVSGVLMLAVGRQTGGMEANAQAARS